jgi:opacity protein-like surface antigen
MKYRSFYLSAIILFAVMIYPTILYSQDIVQESKTFTSKGVVELGGNISYQYESMISQGSESGYFNILSIMPYVGYFITDNIELGMNPIGFQRFWRSGSSTTMVTMLLSPAYNFKTDGNIYPFIEAQLGYTAESSSFSGLSSQTYDGFSWGGRAGIKYAVASHGLLNLAMQYQQFTFKPSGSTSRYGTNTFTLSAGFTIWF